MTAALILAGTRPGGDPLARELGVAHKALIDVGGEPILARVVNALRDAGMARIVVSADDGAVLDLARELGVETIAPASGPSESALAAFERIGAPMVVTTADHALLQGAWVTDLIAGTAPGTVVSVMMARRDEVEAALPGTRRTYLKFADAEWSGCNLFYLAAPEARAALGAWRAVEADRKRPWRLVARLGLANLLAYAMGRLTLDDGIRRLGRRLGLAAQLVPARDGRAAIDVDKPRDLEDVRRLIASEG